MVPPAWEDFASRYGSGKWPRLESRDACRATIMTGDQFFRDITDQAWSPERRIQDMDRLGIDRQVLSPPPVMFCYWAEPKAAQAFARMQNENVAAIVIEPLLGEGGFIEPAKGFLPAIAKFAADHGIVFVADEIQSGFCRTGQWFACEDERIVPDLITTAKGIAGGLPLAAVTGRAEIMDAAHAGGLGGTYGGNPVACAAALATIDLLEGGLIENASARGAEAFAGLAELRRRHPTLVTEVRGKGLMIGIEFGPPKSLKLKASWNLVEAANKGLFCQLVTIPLFKDYKVLTQVAGHASHTRRVV